LGIELEESFLCGGGARSLLWRKILASVLNLKLNIPECEEGPGYGGALLAMVADGAYKTVEDASRALVRIKETIIPNKELALKYENKYEKFKKIYPALKGLYKELKEI
jgi:xylulokinase